MALWTESSKRKPDPPLKQATLLIDLVPVPGLRKKLRKFVADEQQEIIELYEANRKYDMHLSC